MATNRQEIDRGQWEDQARKEVEGQIEQIERKAEIKTSQNNSQIPADLTQAQTTPVYQDMGTAAQTLGRQDRQKIILPLTEDELRQGLHHKVVDGIRWIAEWCRLLIKKYPGRVFYPVEVR